MLNGEQNEIVVDLIRKTVRMMRTDPCRLLRRIEALVEAQEAQVPDHFLLPFSACLSRAIESSRFDLSAAPISVVSLFRKNQQYRSQNLVTLQSLGVRIRKEFRVQPDEAVLAEDGAALAALYEDIGAYPVSHWAAFLRDGTCVNGDKPRALKPFAEEWSERVQIGDSSWRKPKPALMIALLAQYIGDPTNNPVPPMWHHLGLAVLVWKDRIAANEILAIGSKINKRDSAERGLAITAHIFPELSKWLNAASIEMPKWERRFAIPIAARRIIAGEKN
jgi:hypothetical protein